MSQSKGLKIFFAGFLIAGVGVLSGFGGFQFNMRWLSVAGFVIVVIGVAVAFIGILYGWITEGRRALSGSVDAAKDLAQGKINKTR